MGTKDKPGAFDCYARLAPDEPYFTLRAKDPSAPYLVFLWEAVRRGDLVGVANLVVAMQRDPDVRARIHAGDTDKWLEARDCARAMREWRKDKEAADAETAT